MSKYATERKAATHGKIVASAERLIKERGVAGASVEAVMRAAGLTVGGFYAHFPSKEAMVEEALLAGVERSLGSLVEGLDNEPPATFARVLIDRYFAQAADGDLERACPLTLLLPDVARGDSAARRAFAERTAQLVARIESRLPRVEAMAPREVALALFAALVGAVSFARVAATARGRDRILTATRLSMECWMGLAEDPPLHGPVVPAQPRTR